MTDPVPKPTPWRAHNDGNCHHPTCIWCLSAEQYRTGEPMTGPIVDWPV